MARGEVEKLKEALNNHLVDYNKHVAESNNRQERLEDSFCEMIAELKGLREDMKPIVNVYTGSNFLWKAIIGLLGGMGTLVAIAVGIKSIIK